MNALTKSQAHTAPTFDIYATPETFEHAQRVAKAFRSSTLVPEHLRQNDADALLAYGIARSMGEQPLVVMQNIYFVSGRAGWKAEYMIARANRSGVFKGRITWRTTGAGKDLAVTAMAALADTGEVVETTASMAMAMAENWTRNTKYQSMPEHMLRWRSATMLIRLYAPEVMSGLPPVEELEDVATAREDARSMRDVTPKPAQAAAQLENFASAPSPAEEPAPAETVTADGEIIEAAQDDAPTTEDPGLTAAQAYMGMISQCHTASRIQQIVDQAEASAELEGSPYLADVIAAANERREHIKRGR